MNNYCTKEGRVCQYANKDNYCTITGCIHPAGTIKIYSYEDDSNKMANQDYKPLDPLARNELEKAMLGRGVDCETIQLILKDFDVRVKHLYSVVYGMNSK